jgi:hypothetical protein
MKSRNVLIVSQLLLLILNSGHALGYILDHGIPFLTRQEVSGQPMQLKGTGAIRYLGIFKVSPGRQ